PVEDLVASVWAKVLKVKTLTRDSNFFQLGGHSLLATQMVLRLRQIFGCEIPLRTGFDFPVLADLAMQIELLGLSARPSLPLPLRRVPRDQEMPLSSAQERLWLLQQIVPESTAYNIPVTAQLKGSLELPALRFSLAEIVRRHEVLRTSFVQHGQKPVQQIHPDVQFKLEQRDLREIQNGISSLQAIKQELQALASFVFDLRQAPLFKIRILQTADD